MDLRSLSGPRRPDHRVTSWSRGVGALGLTLVMLAGGCGTPSRVDTQSERAVADAAGLADAVEFRTVGPDGGPIDEPDPIGGTLTMAEAVRRAVTTDPGLQAALARVRIAMADADQARLLPNPVLSFVLRWGPGKAQIEASLAQDLITALQSPRRASAADKRLRSAAADAVIVALDVSADVQERYIGVQALDTLVPLLESRLSLLRKLTDTARARLEAGEGTRTDVTILDAQRVELEVEIAAAELQRREERLRLARLVGEPSSAATWTLEPWLAPPVFTGSESQWVDSALNGRPEVQAVVWQLAALGDDAALARWLPWQGGGMGIDAQRDTDWMVGPSVSTPIPIFDTGQARRARITAEQIEARHNLTMAKRRIVEEVRVAYQTLAAGRANLDRIRNELIPLQQQRRQVTEDVYEAERDITPLLLAEQSLRAAQATAIDAEQQAAVALIRLERAVGGRSAARAVRSAVPHASSEVPASSRVASPAVPAPLAATDSQRSTR